MKRILACATLACLLAMTILAGCSPKAEEPASSSAPQPAQKPAAVDVSDNVQKASLPTEPYYVLVIGNDSRNNTVDSKGNDDTGRADTTMLVRIDPTTYQVSMLTIPRETPVWINDEIYRINMAYRFYGSEGYADFISDFTGLDIKYFVELGMAEYVDFYNEIGGVDVYVPKDMTWKDIITGDSISLTQGDQHLNGNEALVLSRVRKVFQYGDPIRQQNSRHMMQSTILQCAKDPALATANLDILLKHAKTNWPVDELSLQIADFCEHADQITFQEGNGPYEGAEREDVGGWYCYEDPDTWAELIRVFSEGGDPASVIPLPPAD